MRPTRLANALRVALPALGLFALLAAVWADAAGAQTATSSQIAVRATARLLSGDVAEFCLDLRSPSQGETRLCPERRFLTVPQAPDGRWLRSRDVFIGPEMSLWVRARRDGGRLDLSVGVNLEGEARGLRRSSWTWSWATASPNRWYRTSEVAIDLPAPTHAELWDTSAGVAAGSARLRIDHGAPEFRLPELGGGDGDLIRLSAARGDADIALIVFWASWAPYATDTLAAIDGLVRADSELTAIGVNVYESSRRDAESAAATYGPEMVHLADETGEVARHYRVDGLPETFVLDDRGVYRAVIRGAAPIAEVRAVIERVRRNR